MMASLEPEALRLLGPLMETGEQAPARLHARLAAAAAREGTLDIVYRVLDTSAGSLLLAAAGQGLVRVAYPAQGPDAALAQLAETVSARILAAPQRLDTAARQLEGYFTHRRTVYDVPVDLQLAKRFRRQALDWPPHIPYGATESYAGGPEAKRALLTLEATG